MASIKQRPDGVWRARYRDAAGKEHARHFPLKRDAQRWIDEVTASVVTGQYVDPKAARLTFREYAETWLTAQVHRDATATLYRGHLERHAYPVLGDLPLGSVLRTTVQGWVKGLTVDAADGARKALSPATIGVVYTVVASVFRAAVRDRKLASTPCDGIALPEVSKARVQPLTTAQVDLLADHVSADAEPGAFNRVIEAKVSELGGHKSLYSEAFYSPEEFAELYGGDLPDRIKALTDPDSRFPGLYEKTVNDA